MAVQVELTKYKILGWGSKIGAACIHVTNIDLIIT